MSQILALFNVWFLFIYFVVTTKKNDIKNLLPFEILMNFHINNVDYFIANIILIAECCRCHLNVLLIYCRLGQDLPILELASVIIRPPSSRISLAIVIQNHVNCLIFPVSGFVAMFRPKWSCGIRNLSLINCLYVFVELMPIYLGFVFLYVKVYSTNKAIFVGTVRNGLVNFALAIIQSAFLVVTTCECVRRRTCPAELEFLFSFLILINKTLRFWFYKLVL